MELKSVLIVGALAVILSWMYRRRMAEVGEALFGPSSRVHMINERWAIEGQVDGWTVRYTTGGTSWIPGTSYLFLSVLVTDDAVATKDGGVTGFPEAARPEIEAIRRRDGFVRLDASRTGGTYNTWARVRWGSAGAGLLLRRYSKHSYDVPFIREDLASLLRIAKTLNV
jgi:hypothetical protein